MPERSFPPDYETLVSDFFATFRTRRVSPDRYDEQYFEDNAVFSASCQWKSEMEQLFSLLGPGASRLLDFGCGSGAGTAWIASNVFDGHVTGFDPHRDFGTLNQSNTATAIDFRLDFTNQLSGQYDTILLSHVIGHLARPAEVLRNLKNMLSERGTLLVVTPNARFRRRALLTARKHRYHPDGTVHRYFSERALRLTVKEAGFDVETCFPWGPLPDICVGLRREGLRMRLLLVGRKL